MVMSLTQHPIATPHAHGNSLSRFTSQTIRVITLVLPLTSRTVDNFSRRTINCGLLDSKLLLNFKFNFFSNDSIVEDITYLAINTLCNQKSHLNDRK